MSAERPQATITTQSAPIWSGILAALGAMTFYAGNFVVARDSIQAPDWLPMI